MDENLKSYINDNATLKTWVGKNKISNSNPMVVFKEARNELNTRSTTYDNTTRIMNYNINIYCNKRNDSREVVEELVVLVNEVMVGFYKMQGGLIAINDNYDDKNKNSCQANLRFTTKFMPKTKRLY